MTKKIVHKSDDDGRIGVTTTEIDIGPYMDLVGTIVRTAATERFWPADVPRETVVDGVKHKTRLSDEQMKSACHRALRWWVECAPLEDEEWAEFCRLVEMKEGRL